MVVAYAALRRAVGLKVWKREGVRMAGRWLELIDGGNVPHTSGRASYSGHVRVGGGSTDAWIQQVIVHELTHICLFRSGVHRDAHHGRKFQGLLMTASAEFFGLDEADIVPAWKASQERHKGSGYLVAYQLDRVIVKLVPESPRDIERVDTEVLKHERELFAKKAATEIADAEGWGRAAAWRGKIHAHRYLPNDGEEFACGFEFDEFGPPSNWFFTKTQLQVTCTRCIKALTTKGDV